MHPPPSHAVCLVTLQVGKPKRTESLVLPPEGLDEAMHALIGKQVGFSGSACLPGCCAGLPWAATGHLRCCLLPAAVLCSRPPHRHITASSSTDHLSIFDLPLVLRSWRRPTAPSRARRSGARRSARCASWRVTTLCSRSCGSGCSSWRAVRPMVPRRWTERMGQRRSTWMERRGCSGVRRRAAAAATITLSLQWRSR